MIGISSYRVLSGVIATQSQVEKHSRQLGQLQLAFSALVGCRKADEIVVLVRGQTLTVGGAVAPS